MLRVDELVAVRLRVAEDDAAPRRRRERRDHRVDRLRPVRVVRRDGDVAHVGRRLDVGVADQVDRLGLLQHVLWRLGAHPLGHRRREEARLPLRVVAHAEDRLHVVGEAHVEHHVGLVERDDAHRLEREVAALIEVLQPAGRADDQVDALPQRARLRPHRRAAVHAQQRELRRDDLELARDLLRELARRRHHERARRARRALRRAQLVEALDRRQPERQRLAHARARAADDVLAREDQLERRRLDREEGVHPSRAERAHRVVRQLELVERERRVAARVVGQRRHGRRRLLVVLVVLVVLRLRVVGRRRLGHREHLGLLGLRRRLGRLGRRRLGIAHALLRRRLDRSHRVLERVVLLGAHLLRELGRQQLLLHGARRGLGLHLAHHRRHRALLRLHRGRHAF